MNPQRDALRTAYDDKAAERNQHQISSLKVEKRGAFLDLLLAEGCHSLLELGAGPGHDGHFFQENGLAVTCTDLSPEMIELCRQKGLDAHVMDMTDLTFEPASFDAVYAWSSLLHLPKRELPAALAGIKRLLVPGGLFFMGVWGGWDSEGIWAKDTYKPKRFFAIYTDEDIKAVVSKQFEIVSFESLAADHREEDECYQVMVLRNALD